MVKSQILQLISGLVAWGIASSVDTFVAQQSGFFWFVGNALFVSAFISLVLNPVVGQPSYFHYSILGVLISVGLGLNLLAYTLLTPVLLTVCAALLPYYFMGRGTVASFFVMNVVFVSLILTFKTDVMVIVTAMSTIGLQLFTLFMSTLMIDAQKKREEILSTHIELLATQGLLAEKNKQDERLRMSRDLHDSIGHQLTALGLKAEHARFKTPDNLPAFFANQKEELSRTLHELRAIVAENRRQQQTDVGAVMSALVEAIPGVYFTCEEIVEINDSELSRQLVFCLQEAASNALRHGQASELSLRIVRQPEITEIQLVDNGRGSDGFEVGGGLTGMAERMSSFQGNAVLKKRESAKGMKLILTFKESHED